MPRLRLITATSPDIDPSRVNFKPADGFVWRVVDLWGWHDSTDSQTCAWYYTDRQEIGPGVGQPRFSVGEGPNVPVAFALGGIVGAAYLNEIMSDVFITQDVYLFFGLNGVSTGKHCYATGLVEEITFEEYTARRVI